MMSEYRTRSKPASPFGVKAVCKRCKKVIYTSSSRNKLAKPRKLCFDCANAFEGEY